MKLSKLILAASAATMVFANISFAAGLEAPKPAYDWTGFYAGVNGGFGFGQNTWNGSTFSNSTQTGNFSGMLGGVTAGANWQRNAWVYGIEADLDVSGLLSVDPEKSGFNCGSSSTCNTSIASLGTLRARVGHEIGGSTLIYATGGLAGGSVAFKIANPATDLNSVTQLGWTVGGGVETAVSEHISVKAEALYVNLGTAPPAPLVCSDCYSNVNFLTARVGLNYKF